MYAGELVYPLNIGLLFNEQNQYHARCANDTEVQEKILLTKAFHIEVFL